MRRLLLYCYRRVTVAFESHEERSQASYQPTLPKRWDYPKLRILNQASRRCQPEAEFRSLVRIFGAAEARTTLALRWVTVSESCSPVAAVSCL